MSGFALLAVFTLLFAAFVASDIELFMAEDEYTVAFQNARVGEYDRISDYRHANITITRIDYSSSSGSGTVYVENSGNIVLDPDYVDFILDGEWFSEESVQLSMSNEWWEPGEELTISFTKTLEGGYHEAKVTTGEGVYATLGFYLPLVPKAIMVYHDSWAPGVPRYRTWNGSLWSNENAAVNVGDAIWWVVLKASRTRNEFILGTLDSGGHVNVQVWQNGTWGDLIELTTGADSEYRGFDITYESVSGDAIVVYSDGTTIPKYRAWNGTAWSAQGSVAAIGSGIPRWIVLASNPNSDEVVLATLDSAGSPDIYAQVWDGDAWGNVVFLEGDAETRNFQCFDVAYESISGRALVVWADDRSSSPQYRVWNGGWSDEFNANSVGTARIYWIKLASEPGTNRILMGTLDGREYINVQTWTGSGWSPNYEVTRSADANDRRIFDVAWENSSGVGMISYGENFDNPKYRTCSGVDCDNGVWSGEDTALDSNDQDDGNPRWINLVPDHNSNDIMLIHLDEQNDIGVQRWTASAWMDPLSVETMADEEYEGFDLVYSLYNPGG
jgi:archaellum component FlaF (FlaF/FlaG flagellin family)